MLMRLLGWGATLYEWLIYMAPMHSRVNTLYVFSVLTVMGEIESCVSVLGEVLNILPAQVKLTARVAQMCVCA